jgi:hypothetical protein
LAQTCDLDLEDFTGTSNTNPPNGWIKGPGINIGPSVPANPILDPAAGFNNVSEYMISKEYNCIGQVCFDWHASTAGSNYDVVISWSQDTSTWHTLDTIETNGSSTPITYQTLCFNFPSDSLSSPFHARIRWQMTRRTGGTFYLENVCISGDSTCAVTPSELRFFFSSAVCREAGTPFSMQICATDAAGFVSDTFNGVIDVSEESGPGQLGGAPSYTAVNGCALLTDVSLSLAGDYTLLASSGSMIGLSDTISILENCPSEVSLKIMSYNLLNYPNGRDDCGANTVIAARWDTLEKIAHYYLPDVLMVCELQNSFGADKILSNSLNSNGYSQYAAASYVPNQSSTNTDLNNMLFYNQNKLTLFQQTEILTTTRDFNQYTFYINNADLGITMDSVFIDFYMAHLKAGSSSSDSLRRITDCTTLREHLDSMPPRNFVLGGDLNLYTAAEQAYQVLTTGIFPFVDPAQMEGPWDNNFQFRKVHSQSTREPGGPNYDCGSGGGVDSRFDFLLISESISNNWMNIEYVDSTYGSLGNDGSIYNKAINDAANTSNVPVHVLNAMYYMSDHMPVVMELNVVLPEPTCIDQVNISDIPIVDGLYSANQSITSTGRVASSSFVTFKAGDFILLNNEFEVEFGAMFLAEIGICP